METFFNVKKELVKKINAIEKFCIRYPTVDHDALCVLFWDSFDLLYDSSGARDYGTMKEIWNRFNYRRVASQVNGCFNQAYELMEFRTVGYTISALKSLGVTTLDELSSLVPEDHEEKLSFVEGVAEKVVEVVYSEGPSSDDVMRTGIEDQDTSDDEEGLPGLMEW